MNENTKNPTPLVWDIQMASLMLGIPVTTLYCWASQKKVPYVKINGRLMFDPAEIKAWIEAQKVEPINAR